MKIKTSKLIAAITATALLASMLGVGAYAIANSSDNFGFNGTYDFTAFADNASASTVTVADVAVDATTTLKLTSTDNDYTLFISIVDADDMSVLSDIKVGYKIGETYYNGMTEGLSNVVYSSLTVKTGDEAAPTATFTAADLGAKFVNIYTSKLVIAEVEGTVSTNAELIITSSTVAVQNFTKEGKDSTFFSISGNLATNKGTVTYNGLTLTQCLKMESKTSITFTLTQASTVKLVFGTDEAEQKVQVGLQTAETLTSYTTDSVGIATIDLPAGDYIIAQDAEINLFYIDIGVQLSVHNWSFNKVTKEPTADEIGTAEFVCTKCSETNSVTLPVISVENYIITEVSNDGHAKVMTYTCTVEGVEVSFDVTTYEHAYSETPSSVTQWNWAENEEDGSWSVTADVVYNCSECEVTKFGVVAANVTSEVGTDEESGEEGTIYTATIEGTDFSDTLFVSVRGITGMTSEYQFASAVGDNDSSTIIKSVSALSQAPWALNDISVFAE